MNLYLTKFHLLITGLLIMAQASTSNGDGYRCEAYFAAEQPSLSVQDFLEQRKPQEAAWKALEDGNTELANKIEEQIQIRLKTAPVVSDLISNPRGSSESFFVLLEGDVKAVFKPEEKHWKKRIFPFHQRRAAERSVAAWKLNQMVGGYLIPVTVLREIDGKLGSLQIFIHENKTGSSSVSLQNAERMRIIDFLVAGWDRPKNVLKVEQGVVGIDYDMSFITKPIHISHGISPPPSFGSIKALIGKYRDTFLRPEREAVIESLKDLLTPQEIEELNTRLDIVFEGPQ